MDSSLIGSSANLHKFVINKILMHDFVHRSLHCVDARWMQSKISHIDIGLSMQAGQNTILKITKASENTNQNRKA